MGRPSHEPEVFYRSFRYQAGSWECARRVVVQVAWHAGELFPRVGFVVTNLKWAKVVRHSRYVVFQLAEVAVPGKLFAALLGQIGRLRVASASG